MPRQRVPVLLQGANVISLRLLNLLRLLRHILSRLCYENDPRARTAKRKDKHENAKQEQPHRPKSLYRQSCQEEHRETTPPQGSLDALLVCSVLSKAEPLASPAFGLTPGGWEMFLRPLSFHRPAWMGDMQLLNTAKV